MLLSFVFELYKNDVVCVVFWDLLFPTSVSVCKAQTHCSHSSSLAVIPFFSLIDNIHWPTNYHSPGNESL